MLLRTLGFVVDRQGSSSHTQWEHPCFKGCRRLVTVSAHNEPFVRKVLKSIQKQMGLSRHEFLRALNDKQYAKQLAVSNPS